MKGEVPYVILQRKNIHFTKEIYELMVFEMVIMKSFVS